MDYHNWCSDEQHNISLYDLCVTGNILCKTCKEETIGQVVEFLDNHQKKLEEAKKILINI
jgi:tryptophanyl-tRNA synthetase